MKSSVDSDYSSGRASASLRTEVEMELLRLERDRLELRSDEAVTRARLNILLGRPSEAALPPLEPTARSASTTSSEAELVERAVAARPEIRRAARGQLEGEIMDSIAGWSAFPEIELMTSYNSMWHDPEHRWMVGLGLSIPTNLTLFRGMKAEAEARARGSKHELEAIALEVRAEVSAAREKLIEIEAAIELYEKRMRPLAEERRDLVRASVDVAVEDYRSLIEAERAVRQVELEILGMRREAARRRVALALALGELPGLAGEERPR